MTIHDKGLGFNDMDVEWTESKVKKTEQELIEYLKKIFDETASRTIEPPSVKAPERKSSPVPGNLTADVLRSRNEKNSRKEELEVVALAKRNESNLEHANASTNL